MQKKKWAGTDRHQPEAIYITNHSIRVRLLILAAAIVGALWGAGVPR